MFSTKGRYALRFMIDLAQHNSRGYVPLKDIAQRQDISLKYLERIALALTQASFVESSHGKGGGYRLLRSADEYTALEILEVMEGSIAPVSCLECNENKCPRANICTTLDMWKGYYKLTLQYFEKYKLSDLANIPQNYDYII